MVSPVRRTSTSQLDEAAQLEFGRYVNDLSDYASQVELLLSRLARSVPLSDPRLEPLLDAANKLVDELRVAADSQNMSERDLAVSQLLPFRVYRAVFAEVSDFQRLPDRLQNVLFDPKVTTTSDEYRQLVPIVDHLNATLQRQADEAVAG
jgi:hypothetical protein